MAPNHSLALLLVAWASEAVLAFDAQMRSKHSSRGKADKDVGYGAHAAATMEVDQYGATKKLHRGAGVKQHQATTDSIAAKASEEPDDPKLKAQKVLEEAATKAEAILAAAGPTARQIQPWTRLHKNRCHDVLESAREHRDTGTQVDLHQLKDLKAYLSFATKQTRKECQQRCMDHSRGKGTDESAGVAKVVDEEGDKTDAEECESIAYFDSTSVKGVAGYCVLFSTKTWMVELDTRLKLDKLAVDSERPLDAAATGGKMPDLVKNDDTIQLDADSADEVIAPAHTGDNIQGPNTNLIKTDTDGATTVDAGATLENPSTDLTDRVSDAHFDEQATERDCNAYEWCCLERHEVLQQIDDAEYRGLQDGAENALEPLNENVDETKNDNTGQEDELQALKENVNELKEMINQTR